VKLNYAINMYVMLVYNCYAIEPGAPDLTNEILHIWFTVWHISAIY